MAAKSGEVNVTVIEEDNDASGKDFEHLTDITHTRVAIETERGNVKFVQAAKKLDALEEEVLAEPAPVTSTPQTIFSLPSVPTANIGGRQPVQQQLESEDDRALRELTASMMA